MSARVQETIEAGKRISPKDDRAQCPEPAELDWTHPEAQAPGRALTGPASAEGEKQAGNQHCWDHQARTNCKSTAQEDQRCRVTELLEHSSGRPGATWKHPSPDKLTPTTSGL